MNDQEAPRVSTIIKFLDDDLSFFHKEYGHAAESIMNDAATYGTRAHEILHNEVSGLPCKYNYGFDDLSSWRDISKKVLQELNAQRVIASEWSFNYCLSNGIHAQSYRGTCDLVVENLEGEYVLCDLKTSKVWNKKKYAAQLGGYAQAWSNPSTNPGVNPIAQNWAINSPRRKIDKICVLHSIDGTKVKAHYFDLNKSIAIFNSCADLYYLRSLDYKMDLSGTAG